MMTQQPGEPDASPLSDLRRSVEELLTAAAQRVHDVVELAAAETRLAAVSGLAMLLLVMIAAAALFIAWGLLVACVLFIFSRTRIDWLIPAFVLVLAHAGLAYYLWQTTARLSRNLTLPQLRTTLQRAASTEITPEAKPDGIALVSGRP